MAQQAEINSEFIITLKETFNRFWQIGSIYLLLMLILRFVEVYWVFNVHALDYKPLSIALNGLIYDFEWIFYILGVVLIIYVTLGFFFPKTIHVLVRLILTILLIIHGALIFYFTKMLLPLGEDLYAYSLNDMILTIQASGEANLKNFLAIAVLFAIIYFITGLGKWFPLNLKTSLILSGICYLYIIIFTLFSGFGKTSSVELETNLNVNKSFYLYNQSYNFFSSGNYLYFDFFLASPTQDNLLVRKEFVNPDFPFLHKNDYPDVLGPYFAEFDTLPDIVFIIVEGLGKAYSGEDAYLGSFSPFLDSLSNHSLYWKNNLSTTGRTFGVLTGIFGSLPFAKNGFMEEAPDLPHHLTLLSLLKKNGYFTNYHIGADINFDKVGTFLTYQKVDRILDVTSFDSDFEETPSNTGFSWGYPDKAVFQNGMRKLPRNLNQPMLTVFQTQTSHDPFIIPDEALYQEMLLKHLTDTMKVPQSAMAGYLNYKSVYASILYVDDAIREFFVEYKKMPNYENTIFIITGDHRLPEIPMATRIDRFHVPLMIYSPKLTRPKRMHGVSTHFEISPTLLSFLNSRYSLEMPSEVAWKGYLLDTSAVFQSHISNPLMRNKNQFLEYISGEFVLSDGQLFKLSDNMNLDPIEDMGMREMLSSQFETYKNYNSYAIDFDKLIPDSLLMYTPEN